MYVNTYKQMYACGVGTSGRDDARVWSRHSGKSDICVLWHTADNNSGCKRIITEMTDTSGFVVHGKGSQKQNQESSVTLLQAIAIPANDHLEYPDDPSDPQTGPSGVDA